MLINTFLHNLAFDRKNRQLLHNLHRLKTHCNHTQEQVEDIPWLVRFLCLCMKSLTIPLLSCNYLMSFEILDLIQNFFVYLILPFWRIAVFIQKYEQIARESVLQVVVIEPVGIYGGIVN